MSVQEAYNTWSATYDTDENLTRDLDQTVTLKSLGGLGPRSVLEIGCGTGKNTALLGRIAEQVHAIDFSENMLRNAKEKLGSDNVIYSVADITERWPCPGESADLVVCNLVLEHIEDLSFVFSEAFRSLVQGGRFFICELHPFRQYQGSKARFHGDQGRTAIQAFVHHLSDFWEAAEENGLALRGLWEWWHDKDRKELPRLVSFMFEK